MLEIFLVQELLAGAFHSIFDATLVLLASGLALGFAIGLARVGEAEELMALSFFLGRPIICPFLGYVQELFCGARYTLQLVERFGSIYRFDSLPQCFHDP